MDRLLADKGDWGYDGWDWGYPRERLPVRSPRWPCTIGNIVYVGHRRARHRRSHRQISVSGGASYATTTSVALTLSATDAGGSGVSQMQLLQRQLHWSAWETYTTSKSWMLLAAGDGAKTVYVQYKDGAGNISSAYSDGITLDATASDRHDVGEQRCHLHRRDSCHGQFERQ